MLTDQAFHLIISVQAVGKGAARRLSYCLSDVIRRSDPGNEPLADWIGRNPGRHAIWLQWSPIIGIQSGGETEGASEMAFAGLKGDRPTQELTEEILRGVEIAIRLGNGYYGPGEPHVSFAPKEVDSGTQE